MPVRRCARLEPAARRELRPAVRGRPRNVLGRGGGAWRRRGSDGHDVEGASAFRRVAVARSAHQRGGRPPTGLAGTRRRGVTPRARLRRFTWAAFKESGDVIVAGQIFAEVGELVTGAKPGRRSAEEVTLFKSLGLAVEDVATADLVYGKVVNTALADEASADRRR